MTLSACIFAHRLGKSSRPGRRGELTCLANCAVSPQARRQWQSAFRITPEIRLRLVLHQPGDVGHRPDTSRAATAFYAPFSVLTELHAFASPRTTGPLFDPEILVHSGESYLPPITTLGPPFPPFSSKTGYRPAAAHESLERSDWPLE